MDLSAKFGKEIPSRNLRKKRSEKESEAAFLDSFRAPWHTLWDSGAPRGGTPFRTLIGHSCGSGPEGPGDSVPGGGVPNFWGHFSANSDPVAAKRLKKDKEVTTSLFKEVEGKAMREFCPIKQEVCRGPRPNLLILNKGAIASLSLFMPFSSNRGSEFFPRYFRPSLPGFDHPVAKGVRHLRSLAKKRDEKGDRCIRKKCPD